MRTHAVMHTPPHPGRIVRQECLEPLGLSVTDAAKALGVSRIAMSQLVNERRGISPEMAIRLSKAFGSAPEVWAGLQLDYDMARAKREAGRITVHKLTGRLTEATQALLKRRSEVAMRRQATLHSPSSLGVGRRSQGAGTNPKDQ